MAQTTRTRKAEELPHDPLEQYPDQATQQALPPDQIHSRDAEEAVLGALLINPDCFPEAAAIVSPADFYILRNGWVMAVVADLVKRREGVDLVTVSLELEKRGQLGEVGGSAYLTALVNQCPTSLNVADYARQVKDYSVRRGMARVAAKIATLAGNTMIELGTVLAAALDAVQRQVQPFDDKRVVIRDAEFAKEPQPPIDYLVDGLITSSSVNVFYGEPGSKKTYAALSMAVSVAAGQPWLEFTTACSPVLFIDEESGERRFARRLHVAINGALLGDTQLPLHFVSLAALRLDTDTDALLLETLIKSTHARLVFIDALADIMTGDENSKADVQPVFNHLRKIAEGTDCAIVVIHHAGKAGGYRGSSAIKAAVDTMVQVQSENGSSFVNFHSEKNRDADKASWAAEAVWTDDQFYLRAVDVLPMGEHKPSQSDVYVLRFLAENGESSLPDIMGAADICSPGAALKAVYRLAEAGKIVRTNPEERGRGIIAWYRQVNQDDGEA